MSCQRSVSSSAFQLSSTSQSFSGQKNTTKNGLETPSLIQDNGRSATLSTNRSKGYAAYQNIPASRLKKSNFSDTPIPNSFKGDWSHLPRDLQFYLAYFYENITHLHYSFKLDSEDFLHTRFLDAALRNEALLYAVVGFSAFQRTVHNPEGKIQDFLQYYNKAVSLLLQSLRKVEKHSNGKILAILQLATFEVRLEPISTQFSLKLIYSRNFLAIGLTYLGIKRQRMKY